MIVEGKGREGKDRKGKERKGRKEREGERELEEREGLGMETLSKKFPLNDFFFPYGSLLASLVKNRGRKTEKRGPILKTKFKFMKQMNIYWLLFYLFFFFLVLLLLLCDLLRSSVGFFQTEKL